MDKLAGALRFFCLMSVAWRLKNNSFLSFLHVVFVFKPLFLCFRLFEFLHIWLKRPSPMQPEVDRRELSAPGALGLWGRTDPHGHEGVVLRGWAVSFGVERGWRCWGFGLGLGLGLGRVDREVGLVELGCWVGFDRWVAVVGEAGW